MTEKDDEIQIVNKMVVTLDICSSSHIFENLLKRSRIDVWKDTLIDIQDYIFREAQKRGAEIYKFTGDGWIILFDPPYLEKQILKLLTGLNRHYESIYESNVFVQIDIPPRISGMTFGLDEGQLLKMKMLDQIEYIGRPLNIACRLQGVINDIDINGGYRAFLSHIAYHLLKQDADSYFPDPTARLLKNISDKPDFKCHRLIISDTKFRIIKAEYGGPNNMINVTFQYTKHVINDRLDAVVSNEIAENDPDKGVLKSLEIEYMHEGKTYKRKFKEKSRIQLP